MTESVYSMYRAGRIGKKVTFVNAMEFARKQTTLCYLVRPGEVLLGMKKCGFGAGKWNGVGGKVEEGEMVEDAAKRECREEIGIVPTTLQEVGTIVFQYANAALTTTCRIFLVPSWEGEPKESDEMRPQWFSIDSLPWDTLWASDRLWLVDALAGKTVSWQLSFDANFQLIAAESKNHPM
jgi:mutator protein MutT